MTFVYGIFGFTFELKLSTRPEKFLGDIDTWNNAEKQVPGSLSRLLVLLKAEYLCLEMDVSELV